MVFICTRKSARLFTWWITFHAGEGSLGLGDHWGNRWLSPSCCCTLARFASALVPNTPNKSSYLRTVNMISYLCKANSKLSPHYIFCNNVIFTLSPDWFLGGVGDGENDKVMVSKLGVSSHLWASHGTVHTVNIICSFVEAEKRRWQRFYIQRAEPLVWTYSTRQLIRVQVCLFSVDVGLGELTLYTAVIYPCLEGKDQKPCLCLSGKMYGKSYKYFRWNLMH